MFHPEALPFGEGSLQQFFGLDCPATGSFIVRTPAWAEDTGERFEAFREILRATEALQNDRL